MLNKINILAEKLMSILDTVLGGIIAVFFTLIIVYMLLNGGIN
ncbi:hypothetical protein OAS41_00865 [Candidatus Marinimicrobia bacterium]|nr:hypothetical protein [Candidatus Neomarinimicrobiota bacterium]MDA9841788.1 hypothetical protein [Candidatus Neomarinimicrobiota bacterium]MDC0878748.1 hypothetical protein [Candidatus Neomarinimicrobiota bacterium]MDC1000450.1 hypothetical protein [Candidatus Neomarinimicrobiota bacterium]MDC1145779.1 hypothetical protein [Candidatus Neomarinimicrobiota bacterium]